MDGRFSSVLRISGRRERTSSRRKKLPSLIESRPLFRNVIGKINFGARFSFFFFSTLNLFGVDDIKGIFIPTKSIVRTRRKFVNYIRNDFFHLLFIKLVKVFSNGISTFVWFKAKEQIVEMSFKDIEEICVLISVSRSISSSSIKTRKSFSITRERGNSLPIGASLGTFFSLLYLSQSP